MQGPDGGKDDKRLRAVVSEMWTSWGFRKGIMRGYWVCCIGSQVVWRRLTLISHQITVVREIPAYAGCVFQLAEFLPLLHMFQPLAVSTQVRLV